MIHVCLGHSYSNLCLALFVRFQTDEHLNFFGNFSLLQTMLQQKALYMSPWAMSKNTSLVCVCVHIYIYTATSVSIPISGHEPPGS